MALSGQDMSQRMSEKIVMLLGSSGMCRDRVGMHCHNKVELRRVVQLNCTDSESPAVLGYATVLCRKLNNCWIIFEVLLTKWPLQSEVVAIARVNDKTK